MKTKVVVLAIVIVLMFTGCAAIKHFFCSPTESQLEAANVGYALAQAALTAATVYVGGVTVAAISSQAIPVFKKVIDGYCVAQAEWDSAVGTLEQVPAAKAMGQKSAAFEFLHSVKWSN